MTGKTLTIALLNLALMAAAPSLMAQQQATVKKPQPQIEDLGNQRYRIGAIEVDKAAGSFRVSGRVLRDEPPIEFLVATKGGFKSYESILEADANAFEFNLACILIGLDADNAPGMEQRSHGTPLSGDPVAVTVSWTQGGKTISVPGSRLMLHGDPPQPVQSDDWIYTASVTLSDGQYLPDVSGTLLGVVQRGESVIEHEQGVGVGNYGSLLVNKELTPGVGEAIVLTITRLGNTGKPTGAASP